MVGLGFTLRSKKIEAAQYSMPPSIFGKNKNSCPNSAFYGLALALTCFAAPKPLALSPLFSPSLLSLHPFTTNAYVTPTSAPHNKEQAPGQSTNISKILNQKFKKFLGAFWFDRIWRLEGKHMTESTKFCPFCKRGFSRTVSRKHLQGCRHAPRDQEAHRQAIEAHQRSVWQKPHDRCGCNRTDNFCLRVGRHVIISSDHRPQKFFWTYPRKNKNTPTKKLIWWRVYVEMDAQVCRVDIRQADMVQCQGGETLSRRLAREAPKAKKSSTYPPTMKVKSSGGVVTLPEVSCF